MAKVVNYHCRSCDFRFSNHNYRFCFDDKMDCIEEYMTLFARSDYGENSLIKGRVIEKYCQNCDKLVRIYQFSPDSSIYTTDASVDFLKYYIPKKHDFFMEAIDFHEELIELIKDNDGNKNLEKIRDFIDDNEVYNIYELNFNHYLNNKRTGFNSNQLIKDVELYLNAICDDLKKFDEFIICINSTEDNFNFDLEGKMFDMNICPDCGEEFYPISLKNPCPKCGKKTMERSKEMMD